MIKKHIAENKTTLTNCDVALGKTSTGIVFFLASNQERNGRPARNHPEGEN